MGNDRGVYKEEYSTCCSSRLQKQPLTDFEFRQKFLVYVSFRKLFAQLLNCKAS